MLYVPIAVVHAVIAEKGLSLSFCTLTLAEGGLIVTVAEPLAISFGVTLVVIAVSNLPPYLILLLLSSNCIVSLVSFLYIAC